MYFEITVFFIALIAAISRYYFLSFAKEGKKLEYNSYVKKKSNPCRPKRMSSIELWNDDHVLTALRTEDWPTMFLTFHDLRIKNSIYGNKNWIRNEYPRQRIAVVFGGCGFIGSHLVEGLVNTGYDIVRVFDIRNQHRYRPRIDNSNLTPSKRNVIIQYIQEDIRNYDQVEKAVIGAQTVFYAVRYRGIELQLSRNINVGGTWNVLSACIKENIRSVVFTSCSDILRSNTTLCHKIENEEDIKKHILEEDIVPSSIFGKSMLEATRLHLQACKSLINGIVLLPNLVYGPGDHWFTENVLLNDLDHELDTCSQNVVHVRHLAKAHCLASDMLLLNRSIVNGNIYLIGDCNINLGLMKDIFSNLEIDISVEKQMEKFDLQHFQPIIFEKCSNAYRHFKWHSSGIEVDDILKYYLSNKV